MKYFTFHYFSYIIFSQVMLYLFSLLFAFFSLRENKIFKIFYLILLNFIIFSDIIFYFSTDINSVKIFSLFSIIICLDTFLIINFFNISSQQNIPSPQKESNITKSLVKRRHDFFQKGFFHLLLILFFFNILTLALYLSFKYLSFSINFFIIIIITFLLTILLFRFFENVKKLKEKKE